MTALQRPSPLRGVYEDPYWSYVAAGELRLQRCTDCAEYRYPPAPVCPQCLGDVHEWVPLSGAATLLAWTVFHRQYFPQLPVPYVVAAVRTGEGPILVGNVVGADAQELRHDMELRATFEAVDSPEGSWRICQWTPVASQPNSEETQ